MKRMALYSLYSLWYFVARACARVCIAVFSLIAAKVKK